MESSLAVMPWRLESCRRLLGIQLGFHEMLPNPESSHPDVRALFLKYRQSLGGGGGGQSADAERPYVHDDPG